MTDYPWWREGIIYQVYPRSFSDSNGDGLGDLPGITSRLDYLASLGVDALWLSPFYPTPDKDFGYDISDYTNVDPRFGSLADFDSLVKAAHQRGLRIVLDLVLNHTSDQHPWFRESRSSRENPRRDWYIWRDPVLKNGKMKEPNNWQACFGGKAWTYDPPTGQYYLHSFTREQPDVNWRNPQVRQAQLNVVRFWLERGADGFRLDVFNTWFKDAQFRDNPPKFGLRGFDRQKHIHDLDQPEMIPVLNELRLLLDSYPGRYAVGETYISTPEKVVSYCGPDKLHAAFHFDFVLSDLIYPFFPWNPRWILECITRRERVFKSASIWPTTVLGNHDQPRPASRYSRGEADDMSRVAMAVLLTMRGTPFIYYGEEIGMRDLRLKRREIMDPPGKKYWPLYKGRDACRAPMQWDASPNAGFSTAKPWLRVHPDFLHRNTAIQAGDPDSILNFTRRLIAIRKENPALCQGDFIPLESGSPRVMLFLRTTSGQSVLVALNFSPRPAVIRLDAPAAQTSAWQGKSLKLLFSSSRQSLLLLGNKLELAGHEVCLLVAP